MKDIIEETRNAQMENAEFKIREAQYINKKIELVPKGNAQNIMNAIIWGNSEGTSKYETPRSN